MMIQHERLELFLPSLGSGSESNQLSHVRVSKRCYASKIALTTFKLQQRMDLDQMRSEVGSRDSEDRGFNGIENGWL